MNCKSIVLKIIILLGLAFNLNSQNIDDALRYSNLIPGGTARVMGAGSSFGAMGGDFGSMGMNIAGLAEYRSSEIAFSFSFNNANTITSLNGSSIGNPESGNEFIIENLGVVFHNEPIASNFRTSNFSIGIQQYSNFNQVFRFNTTSNGSIVQRFEAQGNQNSTSFYEDEFEYGLANEADALILDESTNLFFSDILSSDQVEKEQVVERSGRVNELVFAWSGKHKSQLNIGLGFGIPFISYEENKFYEESDPGDLVPIFNALAFNESLTTSGIGWNFKAGLGYNIKRIFRLGVSYQTPTFLRLDDAYNTSIVYDCTECPNSAVLFSSPDGSFDYKLRTPSRLTGSLGALINTEKIKGFVNLDVTRINYAGNNYDFGNETDNSAANGEIEIELSSALNYNLGAELAYEQFRIRGGINLLDSPFITGTSDDISKIYSAGLGWRGDDLYIDAAYQIRDFNESYTPYSTLDSSPELLLENNTDITKLVLTIGIKI